MIRWLIVAAVMGVAVASGGQESSRPLSLAEYGAELQRVEHDVQQLAAQPQKAEALRQALPQAWTVSEGDRQVEVSTGFLRTALADFQKSTPERKRGLLESVQQRLAAMSEEAAGFTRPGPADATTRERLRQILSAREFRFVRPPSLWEVWRDKFVAWLERWLTRASRKIPDVPGLGRLAVWTVIGLAACVLAVWLYRMSRRRPVKRHREILPFSPSSKSWRAWLNEAEAAAEGGDWRNAVHLAYWAGVSYLETGGAWRPDRARTPREYLRILGTSHPARDIFAVMTRRFENIWYGGRAAGPSEFQAACSELKELGCR